MDCLDRHDRGRAGSRADSRRGTRLLEEEAAPLNVEQRRRVIKHIEDEVLGLGPLEPLLADKKVADILVNGANQVYVERRGSWSSPTSSSTTTRTCCISSTASCRASAAASTNPRRWSTPA